jgi:ubiquitin thioesterase protein OTUB1
MVVQEETRLRSFDETLRMAGIDVDLVVDLFDYTWELFGKIRQAVESRQKDESILTNVFNEEGESNSIVYHFKVSASSWRAGTY